MKIEFHNWFGREIENQDSKKYMYAFNLLPCISVIKEPNWYSISIMFLFWDLTIEKNK
jgi:hypothetical protein